MDKEKTRKVETSKIIVWIIFFVFLVYAITLIYPFVWFLFNSFKDKTEWLTNKFSLPGSPTFKNYTTNVMQYTSSTGYNIAQMFSLSLVITLVGTVLAVLASCMAAYVVSRYDFKAKQVIYAIAVFVIVVPLVGTLPAKIQLMQTIGLYDTLPGLFFLYSGAFGLNFILLHGFFENISWSYAEAAYIDGANDFTVFFKVMLPLSKGPVVSVGILQLISIWNDYSTPLIFLPSMTTLAVGLDELQKACIGKYDYPSMFAAIVIATTPVIVLFACFQKTIIENTVAGGLKG